MDKATSFYASFYSPRFQIPVRGNLGFAIVMDYRTNVLIKVSVKVVPKSETPYTFQIEISRPDKYIFTQVINVLFSFKYDWKLQNNKTRANMCFYFRST